MKNHFENSKKFEIDKILINKIYNIKEKKKPGYKVIKKNVVYHKQITRQYFKYSNINKGNYYSNYQSFREYLSSGYDHEFLTNEIKNIRSIIDYSRSIREIITKKLNPDKNQNISLKESIPQNPAIIEGPTGNNVNNPTNQNNIFQKSGSIRRPSAVLFHIDRENPSMKRLAEMAHQNSNFGTNIQKKNNKLIEKCLLFKKKEEEIDAPDNQYYFRLYSVLSEEFDPLFLPEYENFIKVKYENQKNCLIKFYNKEKEFINCAKLIKEKIKSMVEQNKQNQMENSDSFNSRKILQQNNIKENFDMNIKNMNQNEAQLKIPYINAFFYGRTEMYFRDIDNFMSLYKENTSLASKQLEKDFFENLYKILTYNNTNCKRFLHYLYYNNNFFKYIYNIFTTQKKLDGTLKNIAPSIRRHSEKEHFLNKPLKEMFLSEDKEKEEEEKNKMIFIPKDEENEKKDSKKDINDFLNSLIGNDFIYKINLIQDDVTELVDKKQIKKFKKLIMNNDRYENNFIITLNNKNNMLQIYNTDNNQCIFSYFFDETISFFDLANDLKNNLKIEKIQKNEKFILIYQKNNFSNFNNSYIFKLPKEIYSRFCKSISARGFKIKKTELFGTGEKEKDKEQDNKKLNLGDLLNLQGEEEKNQSGEHSQNSEKDSAKNESNIKFEQKNNSRSISFRNNNSINKSNSENEKSDNEEKEKFKQNNDSSMEVKEKEGEDSEEDENEDDNEEKDGEEDENDNNNDEEDNNNNNDENPKNKKDENKEEDENDDKDNINNDFTEEKDDEKNRDNNTNKNMNTPNNNEEEINTDIIGQNIIDNNPTIESNHKSSDKEE